MIAHAEVIKIKQITVFQSTKYRKLFLIFPHSRYYVNHIGLMVSRHPCINIKIKVSTTIINGMAAIKHGININRRFKCFLTSKSLI